MFPSLVPFDGCLFVISLLIGRFQASSTDGNGFVNFADAEGVFGLEFGGNGMFDSVVFRYFIL